MVRCCRAGGVLRPSSGRLWPVAETRMAGEGLRLLRSSVADAHARAAAPGTVLGLGDDGLRVACGEGVLALNELQRAGKRPVSARDFTNAVRLAGLRFES